MGERLERLAPDFVDSLAAAVMFYLAAQLQRFLETVAAFAH